jgi:hypothetical protein
MYPLCSARRAPWFAGVASESAVLLTGRGQAGYRDLIKAKPGLWGRLCKWLILAVYYVVIVGIALEVAVRLFIPQVLPVDAPRIFRPDQTIGWRNNPNVRAWANTGERDVEVCTDGRGDRISCKEPHLAHCAKRILIVGDSFVEALAVPFEETVWSRLEKDTGACVDVAGVGGYEPSQYLQLVRERLRGRDPNYDLVVASMFAGNDFMPDAERLPAPTDVWRRPLRLLPKGLDEDSLLDWFYPFNQWLESRSEAYVALRFAVRNLRDPGDIGIYGLPIALVRDSLTPQILRATTRSFELIADEVREAGSKLLITVVPVRNQVADPTGARIRAAFPAIADKIDMDLVQEEFIPRLHAIEGVTVVDLLPTLRAEAAPDDWGTRDQHLSPKGHAAWFRALREPVREALGLRER